MKNSTTFTISTWIKLAIWIVLLVIQLCSVQAQYSQSDWLNIHNSGGSNVDDSFSHAIDNQGNTYVTGYGAPGGYPNGLLVKINPTGTVIWSKNFYGYNGGNAIGRKVLLYQNYIYVVSEGMSYGNSWDMWLHKFDENGNILFSVRYGEPAYNESIGDAIFDNSGNIIVAVSGRTYADSLYNMNLIKYNTSGTPVLFASYDAPGGNAYAQKLLSDASGNIFVASSVSYPQQSDLSGVLILKYNSLFQLSGSYSLFGPYGTQTYFGDAELMLGSDLVFCSSYPESYGEKDLVIIKLNNFLTPVWVKHHNVVSGRDELPADMIFDANNNIHITGNADAYSVMPDVMTVKLNIDGNFIWSKIYDRSGHYDVADKIALDNSGNVYCSGISSGTQYNMDAMVIKYDASGNQQFVYNYNGLAFDTDKFSFLTVTPSGMITATGSTTRSGTGADFLTVRLTGNLTGISGISNEIPEGFSLKQNYPNPFNPSTKIEFSIAKATFVKMAVYDVTGKEVEVLVNENLNAGSFEVDFNASKLTSGVYFCKITAGEFTDVKKMILTK